jgi:hypothetical protein
MGKARDVERHDWSQSRGVYPMASRRSLIFEMEYGWSQRARINTYNIVFPMFPCKVIIP